MIFLTIALTCNSCSIVSPERTVRLDAKWESFPIGESMPQGWTRSGRSHRCPGCKPARRRK